MADIIKDGETGLLFTPGDAVALAGKAKWSLENPQQTQLFGVNAMRTFLDKYADAELVATYADARRQGRMSF